MPSPVTTTQDQRLITLGPITLAARGEPAPFSIFCHGFRPFFLLAGIWACLPLASWVGVLLGLYAFPVGWGAMLWHGHEMVFGFVPAAIAGFLLTAVPNWTNTPRVQGAPLIALSALWLVGRLALLLAGSLPAWLVAIVDLLFLPALAGLVVAPIFQARKARNYGFPLLLVLLAGANGLTHLSALGLAQSMSLFGLRMGVYVELALVLVVGGRIVPNFTAAAFRRANRELPLRQSQTLDRASLVVAIAALAVDLGSPGLVSGVLSLVAAVLLAARLIGWRGLRAVGSSIVFVMHVGLSFVVLGFVARGAVGLGLESPGTAPLHLFTAGAIGLTVLAVMSRAALGHSGRPLTAGKALTLAYGLVALGAVIRGLFPFIGGVLGGKAPVLGGICWALGYGIFVVLFVPVLLRPRLDGKPG